MTNALPHNLDAEASILGAAIVRPELLTRLELETDDFYDHRHQVTWEALRNLEANGTPIDVVTLDAEIDRRGKLEAIGGIAFLGELTLRVPTTDNVVAYAKIVENHARVRAQAIAFSELAQRAVGWYDDPDELVGEAMATLAKLDRAQPDATVTIGELVKRRVRELEELARVRETGATGLVGVPTGIKSLDARIGGYPLGDISLLGARPAMGKTAMAMAAVDAATQASYGAHVFSQEGGWRMYADRAIARATGISVERVRKGEFAAGDAARVGHAMMRYGLRKNWLLDDRAGLSAAEIIRSVRRFKKTNNTKLVVIDYIQILRRSRGLSENEALDEIITMFAHAALADDVAYLVLSQLNREVEKRVDKRPQKSDLRGSGALEERPRVIVSPYRGAYYYDVPKKGVEYDCDCQDGTHCTHAPNAEQFKQLVQVLLLKNSNGQEGLVEATWRGETTEMF